ncbi:MAG TPA: hypothetical protein VFS58_14225 [Steroidobacteraceae bacterium]|nr:hypothetical protein [Steroidobacteraceae bacterium]
MFKRAAFALLLCTSAFGADEPKWLKDARARESKSLKPVEIKSKDGWFTARTPGKLVNTVEEVEGSYSVELDIGGDASVHCEVYPKGVDMANALRVTLGNSIKEIESSQGKIEVRALEGTDAGAFGAVPYISLTWLYRVAGPDGALVGSLKQFVMEKGESGVYCAHNDLGFTRTFTAITRAFAESLDTQQPVGAPQYVEISVASMSGAKIGVAVSTLERDSEGDSKARQMTAMLIATDDGAVQSQDAVHINWVRPDGTLINASNTEVANGELSNSLALKTEDGVWIVEGEVQGKDVKATLPKDSQPGNWVAQAQQLRALLAEPDSVGREHTMGIWLAENPEKLTVAKTKILAKKGDKHFTARGEIGGITANLTLEKANGMASAADLKIGPLNLTLERVYVSGGF